MRDTITVSLPGEVRKRVDEVARREGLSRSDIVREAIEQHLFHRRFRSLRQRLMAKAQARGAFTDEDVFGRVS